MSNSNAPRPLARLRQTEDPAVAVAVLLQLDELSLPELLDRLETAVVDERFTDAEDLLQVIRNRYQERAESESRTRAKAQLSRGRSGSDLSKSQQLTQYLQSASVTSTQRAQLFIEVATFVESEGNSGSSSSVQQTIAATRQQEQQFEQAAQKAETIIAADSLPARVELTAVSLETTQPAVGEATNVSVAIMNVGDTPARDVELRISAGDVTEVEQSTITVGTVDPTESVNQTVALTGAQEGTSSITVTATSANAGSASESVTVSVLSVEDSQAQLSASVQQAGTPGGQARVQYTVSNVSGQSSVAVAFEPLPSALSINPEASDTTGVFDGATLVFSDPSSSLTPTVAFDIAAGLSPPTTVETDAAVLDETRATTDRVTTALEITAEGADSPLDGLAGEYDDDGDGTITAQELGGAVTDFAQGELSAQELGEVVTAFAQS